MTPASLSRRQPWVRWLLWLAALVSLAGVLQAVSLRMVWGSLSRLEIGPLFLLAAANGLVLVTLTGRWWLLLRAWGFAIPYFTLVGYRLAAFGVSYFTPGPQFGGEPLQVYLVHRHHRVPSATAVSAVTLDKLLELLVNFAFLVGGVLLITRQALFSAPMRAMMTLFAISLLALPAGGLLLLARGGAPLSGLLQITRRMAAPLAGKMPASPWARRYQQAINVARTSERQLAAFLSGAAGNTAAGAPGLSGQLGYANWRILADAVSAGRTAVADPSATGPHGGASGQSCFRYRAGWARWKQARWLP